MLLNDLYQVARPRSTPRGRPRTRAKPKARTRSTASSKALAEDDKLSSLVAILKAKLPCLSADEIEKRSKDLIFATAELWKEKEFLVVHKSDLRKSPQLQRVWDDLSKRASVSQTREAGTFMHR
jgi:hypothetical protein